MGLENWHFSPPELLSAIATNINFIKDGREKAARAVGKILIDMNFEVVRILGMVEMFCIK